MPLSLETVPTEFTVASGIKFEYRSLVRKMILVGTAPLVKSCPVGFRVFLRR
jgi:hypothetical protein